MGLFKKKKQDEYEHFYGNNQESDVEIVETEYGEIYDEVYDEEGSFVPCDYCNGYIKWKDGTYICSDCGQTMSRDVFFNYIGAEPPGPECLTCDNLYPGCVICHHGYINDDD